MDNIIKKGSKVRVVSDSRHFNKELTVIEVDQAITTNLPYCCRSKKGEPIWFSRDEIELIPPEEVSMPDKYFRPQSAIEPKPTIGIKPKRIHDQERQRDIVDAMTRYIEAGQNIPIEWAEELAALILNR